VRERKEACEPRCVLLWRRVSAGPLTRSSGDFSQSLILTEERGLKRDKSPREEVSRLLCVSFECDSLSAEFGEESFVASFGQVNRRTCELRVTHLGLSVLAFFINLLLLILNHCRFSVTIRVEMV
jgi:hypothetical protein